jgi:hypothetical protein
MPATAKIDEAAGIGIKVEAGEIDRTLALGFRLLAAVEAFATQFAFDELGDIDLPPVMAGSETEQAHLRAIAPLYLASELESARLLPAVEMLAGLFVSGGLSGDLGPATTLVVNFWKNRRERLSAQERRAFFSRLFGNDLGSSLAAPGGRNTAFEMLMTDFTEALYKLDEHPTFRAEAGAYEETRLRQAASQLADNLISRSSGIAGFAARDILENIQQALEILKQTPVQRAVGASSVWGAVRSIAERYMNESFDISSHVTRGKAGMMVLAWLVEALPHLGDYNAPLVALNHPVIAAATEWLQASLALEERSLTPIETR